jgi:hypothetical protein
MAIMARKFIAALLLLVVAAWAEVLLAPMFTVHAMHTHPAHDMAQPMEMRHHTMPATHPCCPGLHKAAQTAPTVEFTAASLPCADQHRCCFRQGPQSAPAPVRASANESREVAAIAARALQPSVCTGPLISVTFASPLPLPPALGMVLRI